MGIEYILHISGEHKTIVGFEVVPYDSTKNQPPAAHQEETEATIYCIYCGTTTLHWKNTITHAWICSKCGY